MVPFGTIRYDVIRYKPDVRSPLVHTNLPQKTLIHERKNQIRDNLTFV